MRMIYDGHEYRYTDGMLFNNYGTHVATLLKDYPAFEYLYAETNAGEPIASIHVNVIADTKQARAQWLMQAYVASEY